MQSAHREERRQGRKGRRERKRGRRVSRGESEEKSQKAFQRQKETKMLYFKVEVMLTSVDRGINMSRASDSKHCQKSKREVFNMRKIHNAYCIIPSALCKIQLQFSYCDRQ